MGDEESGGGGLRLSWGKVGRKIKRGSPGRCGDREGEKIGKGEC